MLLCHTVFLVHWCEHPFYGALLYQCRNPDNYCCILSEISPMGANRSQFFLVKNHIHEPFGQLTSVPDLPAPDIHLALRLLPAYDIFTGNNRNEDTNTGLSCLRFQITERNLPDGLPGIFRFQVHGDFRTPVTGITIMVPVETTIPHTIRVFPDEKRRVS